MPIKNKQHISDTDMAVTKEEQFVLKRLVWHGILRRKEIESLLQISSDFASRIIGRVRQMVSTTPEGKAYLFNGEIPETVTAHDFLEDVRRSAISGVSLEQIAGTNIPSFVLTAPDQHVDTAVLRDIVQAIKTKRALGISYTGTQLGETTRNRVIEPVALIFINDRWHVHAYTLPTEVNERGNNIQVSLKGGWRDFVLSRIGASFGRLHDATHTLADCDGMVMVSLKIGPHPDLTENQQKMVSNAWNMTNGKLKLTMTHNQLFYFRKQYVASAGERPPEKLLIALAE